MYRAPVSEIAFTLKHVAGLDEVVAASGNADLGDDLVSAILEEAGRFASEEMAPLNRIGDTHGTPFENGEVRTPPGWRDVYHHWIEGGWNGLTASAEFGGQELPALLHTAAMEMWNSACMAFMLGPTLTVGAIEALEKHGSDELRATYLGKLVSGEWMGTMNLTEPQAGSDLNALRARAERNSDGTYSIFGQKIFITYGDHDITDNIVHLVLARLPDAPAGTRGISLFVVPKFIPDETGAPGRRNDVRCAGVEHKLGIHGSPTCTMVFGDEGGATGWLVGEENRGLACMFTMMNSARLGVGLQGVGIAELAYQQAFAYAQDRRQGKAAGAADEGMSPIIAHPDIQRSLLTMRAQVQVARSICYACAQAIDMARYSRDGEKTRWSELAGLWTPVAKALSTDFGVEAASIGVQVHGGMGFIEETGAAQLLRDARIAPIYEGTNGIQAIDLVTRKLPLSGGSTVRALISELRDVAETARASNRPEFGQMGERVFDALDDLEAATEWLLEALRDGRSAEALAGATPYLRLFGLASGGALLARGALASPAGTAGDGSPADNLRVLTGRYFAENMIGECAGLRRTVTEGGVAVLEAGEALLAG